MTQCEITTDVLVIGAGPAGLGAAIEVASCGLGVLAIDENDRAGGQLYKQIHRFFGSHEHFAGLRGFQIADSLISEAQALGVEIKLSARALGLLDNQTVSVFSEGYVFAVKAKKIILATGGSENSLAFPGWTLPGVMTAGAAQTMANVHGVRVGKRALVVGSGNVGLIVAYQMLQAGIDIVGLVEIAPEISGYTVHAGKIQRAGVPILTSHTIIAARGRDFVEEAVIAQVDTSFRPIEGTEQSLQVDTVLLAVGLQPRLDLASMFGLETMFVSTLGGRLPVHNRYMRSSRKDVYVAGDLSGIEEASTALDEGRLAGLSAALSLVPETGNNREKAGECINSLTALRSGSTAEQRDKCKASIVEKGEAL